jgi:hypothetical protein
MPLVQGPHGGHKHNPGPLLADETLDDGRLTDDSHRERKNLIGFPLRTPERNIHRKVGSGQRFLALVNTRDVPVQSGWFRSGCGQ